MEVQLRTTGQHFWAEQVERTSSRTGMKLKDAEGSADLLEYFRVASELTSQQESGDALDKELQQRLANLREKVRPYFGG